MYLYINQGAATFHVLFFFQSLSLYLCEQLEPYVSNLSFDTECLFKRDWYSLIPSSTKHDESGLVHFVVYSIDGGFLIGIYYRTFDSENISWIHAITKTCGKDNLEPQ